MQKNYFLYLHPSDFLLADLYLEKLKKKEIVKKLDKNILFYSSKFLKNLNVKKKYSKIIKKFDKFYDIDFFDNGLNDSIISEIRKVNYINILLRVLKLKIFLKDIVMKKSNLFVGGGIADFALSARVVIGYFKSIKSNNIFYTGIDLPIMDNKWKNSSISTISSNIFSFLGIPSVTSFKNFNNLIEMKFFNKNIYKKFFILSNFSFKKKNIEFLDCSLNNNKKKKIILFIDKDDISDWCKVKKNYKNYLKTKEKVLEIISNNFKTKYDLIYKPHPRQNKIEQNIFDFKIKYKNLYLENLLKFKKDKIFMTIGIVSLGLKISNLYGIKTMSIKNLLLKNHIWTNKRLDLNSKIINLNSLDMLTKNIKSDSKNKIKVITECYYS